MSFLKKHNQIGSFHCAICTKDLKDAASISDGIGPICRNKANEILAKEMPFSVNDVQFTGLCVNPLDLPENCRSVWNDEVYPVLYDLKKVEKNDFRKEVKRIAWILSHGMKSTIREVLILMIEKIGYTGYASLLRGMGFAKVEYNSTNAMLSVNAKFNKDFYTELKGLMVSAYQGYYEATKQGMTYASKGKNAEIGCRGKFWAQFEALVTKHFPITDGLQEALDAAKVAFPDGYTPKPTIAPIEAPKQASAVVEKFLTNIFNSTPKPTIAPIEAPKPATNEIKIVIIQGKKMNSVVAPYSPEFVTAIKTLSWRKWMPESKVWGFSIGDTEKVKEMARKVWGASVAFEYETFLAVGAA